MCDSKFALIEDWVVHPPSKRERLNLFCGGLSRSSRSYIDHDQDIHRREQQTMTLKQETSNNNTYCLIATATAPTATKHIEQCMPSVVHMNETGCHQEVVGGMFPWMEFSEPTKNHSRINTVFLSRPHFLSFCKFSFQNMKPHV
jgi:hypothetical protein